MLSISPSWLLMALLAQPAPAGADASTNPPKASGASSGTPTEKTPAPGSAAADPKAAPAKAAAAKPEPDTPATKYVRDAAAKLSKHKYLYGEFTMTLRERDRTMRTLGILKIAPRNRFWLEIKTPDNGARRLFASDGVLGYRHRKILDQEATSVFQMNEITPVVRELGLPQNILRTVLVMEGLPRLDPADMLNGYLDTVHFDVIKPGKQEGTRKVTIVEGKWKKEQIARFKSAQEALGGPTDEETFPSYVRLAFDEQTLWPITMSMFVRNRFVELLPLLKVEFTRMELDKEIADKEFNFSPPSAPTPETNELINRLKTHALNYQRSLAANPATAPAPAAPTAPTPAPIAKP